MYYRRKRDFDVRTILEGVPDAVAAVRGAADYPEINGTVRFYQALNGVLVVADIHSLPARAEECGNDIFAFHIHGGADCTGNDSDEFADAGTHFNPQGCSHPYHAGDMPPMFSAGGKAFLAFLTDRFSVNEIIGKTVIIHGAPDDFATQPSGNAGKKIACGEIEYYK